MFSPMLRLQIVVQFSLLISESRFIAKTSPKIYELFRSKSDRGNQARFLAIDFNISIYFSTAKEKRWSTGCRAWGARLQKLVHEITSINVSIVNEWLRSDPTLNRHPRCTWEIIICIY